MYVILKKHWCIHFFPAKSSLFSRRQPEKVIIDNPSHADVLPHHDAQREGSIILQLAGGPTNRVFMLAGSK